MAIEFESSDLTELTPKIAVIGVGGAGCNAVSNMIKANLQGVDFIVANTDAQSLLSVPADTRIQLGVQITQGLGAGAQPKVGEAAAEESQAMIDKILDGCHMAFITAGMGGGTGTGASPVIARRARERGILTVGVVTRPFQFEGSRRMKIAEAGIKELANHVDTLIIIPNQNLFNVANERTTFAEAFKIADDVLHSGVRSITDLMVMPGLINLDFADVRTVMSEMGKAMMGTGEASGEDRARLAAEAAISNPLLEDSSLKGAKGVIINVTGGMDMTLYEVDEAVNMVRALVDEDALIVFGSAYSESLDGQIRVSVVATGIEGGAAPAFARMQAQENAARDAQFALERAEKLGHGRNNTQAQSLAQSPAQSPAQSEELPLDLSGLEMSPADAIDATEAAALERQENAFVGEAPIDIEAEENGLKSPNIFREADYINAAHPKMATSDKSRPQGEAAMTTQSGQPIEERQNDNRRYAPKSAPIERAATLDKPTITEKPAPTSFFQKVTQRFSAEPVTGKKMEIGSATAENKPSLGALSDDDRLVPKRENEDQMEIPAFLRRQQN